jgi:SlyX protein
MKDAGMTAVEYRLVELESRLSFQEHLLQELNEALTSQQVQMDALRQALDAIREQVKAGSEADIRPESGEAPPPHY